MDESGFWAKVAKAFNENGARARKLHAGMFEDGTPDGVYCVNGVTGFLELKYVPRRPVREKTPVLVRVTPTQGAWMEDWVQAGGRAHVLLGVENEWFLLRLSDIPEDRRMTHNTLRDVSLMFGTMKGLNMLPGWIAVCEAKSLY